MKIALLLRIETFLAFFSKQGHYGIYDILRILISVTLRRSGSCAQDLKQSSRSNIEDRCSILSHPCAYDLTVTVHAHGIHFALSRKDIAPWSET